MRLITLKLLIPLIVILVAGVILFPCNKERAITSLIKNGSRYLEEENREKLLSLVSLYYKDSLGITYASAGGLFKQAFDEYRDITVDYSVRNITIWKDTCIATTEVWTHATWAEGSIDLVGTERDPELFEISFVRSIFKWKVITTRWPGNQPGFLKALTGL